MHIGRKHKDEMKIFKAIKLTRDPIKCLGIYVGQNNDECEKLNWNNKIEQIDKIFQKWGKRGLTIFGKITLIKIFILPKLTFTATNTTLPENIIKQLNTCLYNFIWGKRDRIKRNILIQKIENGGVGMIDIDSHFQAVKASWVSKIMNCENNWNFLGKSYFDNFGKQYIALQFSSVNERNLPMLKHVPKFYCEIIKAHSNAKFYEKPTTREDILNEFVWGNILISHNIKNKIQCIFFKSFMQQNIIKVKDLIFINGKIDQAYLHKTITEKQNIFGEISSLTQALKPYKELLQNYTNYPNETHLDLNYVPLVRTCSDFYNIYIEKKREIPRSEIIYENEMYGQSIDFRLSYLNKVKLINNPKFAEFNYKVLHLILPCNDNLYKWGKQESNLCNICNTVETIVHLLYECSHAQMFWNLVTNATNIDISKFMVIFGNGCEIYNNIISMISYFIYKEWLIMKHENKKRKWETTLPFLNKELNYQISLYTLLKNPIVTNIMYNIKGELNR